MRCTSISIERAVASLLFEPLGLSHSFFAPGDILTRRFAVGHNLDEDGTLSVARLWKRWRGDNPGGGLLFATQTVGQVRAGLQERDPERWEEVVALLDQAEDSGVRRDFETARKHIDSVLARLA